MEHSADIKNLATALAQAQAEMKPAVFNAKNPFLKSDYADLGSVIEAAREPLACHGLSVSQFPVSDGDKLGIETVLMHASGEWISERAYLPIVDEKGKSSAQVAGSVITYLRRYSLSAVLGIYADADNDGNEQAKATQPAKGAVRPAVPAAAPATDGNGHEQPPAQTLGLAPAPVIPPKESGHIPEEQLAVLVAKWHEQITRPQTEEKLKKERSYTTAKLAVISHDGHDELRHAIVRHYFPERQGLSDLEAHELYGFRDWMQTDAAKEDIVKVVAQLKQIPA